MSIHTRLVPGQNRRENQPGCREGCMITLTVIAAIAFSLAVVGIAIIALGMV